jgi:hypothetical protein
MFATQSVWQLRDVTIDVLLGEMFSVRSAPRRYKQDKFKFYLIVKGSPASKDVNTEAEEATVLEAVTRRQTVKIQ